MIAIALFLGAVATSAAPESAVSVPDDVYLAVLDPQTKPGSILCVTINGADPEPALAQRIAALPGTARSADCRTKDNITVFEPVADRTAPVFKNCVEGTQGMKTCELSGPRAVFMNIGSCVAKPAEEFECRISSYCGMLCGGVWTVRVRRTNAIWKVDKTELNVIY